MKFSIFLCLNCFLVIIFGIAPVFGQTNSWTGATSTNWTTASNWTDGVPTATSDVIIGDHHFAGSFKPEMSTATTVKSLDIRGAAKSELTVSNSLAVLGNITISSAGSLHSSAAINATGNISVRDNGILNSSASITLAGNLETTSVGSISQTSGTTTMSGAAANIFGENIVMNNLEISGVVSINTYALVTVAGNLEVATGGSLQASAGKITMSGAGKVIMNADAEALTFNELYTSGTITTASDFSVRYAMHSPGTFNASLGTVKFTTESFLSGTASFYSLNISGTSLTLQSNAVLSILNSLTGNLRAGSYNPTTVNYNGPGNQVIASAEYKNLSLSGGGIKTAAVGIEVHQAFTIAALTTFNAANFTHKFHGTWTNNGMMQPGTSTIDFRSAATTIAGNSTQDFYSLYNNTNVDITASVTTLNIAGDLFAGAGITHAGTLTMSGAGKIMNGRLLLNNLDVTGSCTIDLGGGVQYATITGNLAVSNALNVINGELRMTGTNKTIVNTGTLSLNGLVTSGSITTSADFSISGSLKSSGVFSANAGVINFIETGTKYLEGTVTLFNAIISGGSVVLHPNTVVSIVGSLVTQGGGYLNATQFEPSTVQYIGGNQTVLASTYRTLILSNGGTKTAGGRIVSENDLIIHAGTSFDAGSFTHDVYGSWMNDGILIPQTSTFLFKRHNAITIGGSGIHQFYNLHIENSSATFSANVIAVAGNLHAGPGFTQASGTLTMTGVDKLMTGWLTLNNLEVTGVINISLSGGVTRTVVTGNLNVTNALTTTEELHMNGVGKTITNSGSLAFSGLVVNGSVTTASDFSLKDNFFNFGSFTATAGTVQFINGPSFGHYYGGNSQFYNLSINHHDLILQKDAVLNIANVFSRNAAGLNATANGFTPTTVNYNGPANQTILQAVYFNLTLSNGFTADGYTKTAEGAITVSNELNIAPATTFNAGSFEHTMWGNWVNNGILAPATSTFRFDAIGKTIGGTGIQNFYNLTIERWNVNVDASTNLISVAGNLIANAGFTQPGGTLTMTGLNKTITGNIAIDNLTIDGTVTIFSHNRTQIINGNLAVGSGASLVAWDGKITLAGSNKTIVNAGLLKFKTLWVSGSITTATDFTIDVSILTINPGSFSASAGTATFTTSADNRQTYIDGPGTIQLFNIHINNAELILRDVILKISSNVSKELLGSLNPYVNSFTTVHYNGPVDQNVQVTGYQNLILSNGGTKSVAGSISVYKDFTIDAFTSFNAATFVHIVNGNLTNKGTFVAGSSTIELRGALNANILGATTFNNLTVYKDATMNSVTLLDDIAATHLHFVRGKLTTGDATITATTVSNAFQETGWVHGNLKKYISEGSNVEQVFQIGDEDNYLPATVQFASVTTAGGLTARTIAADHAELESSGIDTVLHVKRYWTLLNSGTGFTTATATFSWKAADKDAGATALQFRTARYDGSLWTFSSPALTQATAIQATGLTSFGDFAVGERLRVTKWTGNALTQDWHNPKNWYGNVPDATIQTLIPTTLKPACAFPLINTSIVAIDTLFIQTDALVNIGNATLQIKGAIVNNGVLIANEGTIEMNGTVPQTIPANAFAGNKIKNLIISNNVSLLGRDSLTGTLTVGAGKTFSTNDNLILKSTATGTARVGALPVDGAGVATAFITGNISIERHLPMRNSWRLLSAPVKSEGAPSIHASWQEGATTASPNANPTPGYGVFIQGGTVANGFDQGLTSNPTVKVFNNSNNTFTGLPGVPGTSIPITNYPGYFVFLRGDRSINLSQGTSATITASTLRMQGQLNTGNVSSNVYATGYTLFGNPYASAINFETLTRTNVRNGFYAWDPHLSGNFGLGGYVTASWDSIEGNYDFTASVSPVSQFIASGQAIMVQSGDSLTAGSIVVKESDKSDSSAGVVFGRTNGFRQQVRVNLLSANANGSTTLIDGILTTYDDDHVNVVNSQDAKKLTSGSENVGIKRQGLMLAIERRKTITASDTSFLNLYQMKLGNYKLEITTNNMHLTNAVAVVKDSYSNTTNNFPVDMNGVTIVPFTISNDPGSYATGRFSIVFNPAAVLPVTFTNVKAYAQQKEVMVEWGTSNEVNVQQYEVEKSADAVSFNTIHTTAATATNGATAQYKIVDAQPSNGSNYYRIKSVDVGGQAAYSKTVQVNMTLPKDAPSVNVYPNPVVGKTIAIRFGNVTQGQYQAQLFDALGKMVASKTIQHAGTNAVHGFEINEKFGAGKYELQITGNGLKLTTSLMKR